MTTVVHCRKAPFDVYIGRAHQEFPASRWGNPFPITPTRTRWQALAEYETYLRGNADLMAALPELRDKVLGCWCKGTAPGNVGCHGDILAKLVEEMEDDRYTAMCEEAEGRLGEDEIPDGVFEAALGMPSREAQEFVYGESITGAEYHVNGLAENEAEGRQSEVPYVETPETRAQAIDRGARQPVTPHVTPHVTPQVTPHVAQTDVLPVFASTYSYGAQSLMTLEEAGKTKPGNAASICDLAKDHAFKQVVLCDSRFDGFFEAQRNLAKAGAQLIFGLKLTVVPDMAQKDDASRVQESTVIVFMRDATPTPADVQSPAYVDLVRLHNRAWTTGSYKGQGRIDWAALKELWTPNLALALPFFSSFLARNTLTFSTITPNLPCAPTVFREVGSDLPFAHLIDEAIDRYVAQTRCAVQRVKSVYYRDSAAFEEYSILRARENHGTLSAPRVDNLASDRFSWQAFKELTT